MFDSMPMSPTLLYFDLNLLNYSIYVHPHPALFLYIASFFFPACSLPSITPTQYELFKSSVPRPLYSLSLFPSFIFSLHFTLYFISTLFPSFHTLSSLHPLITSSPTWFRFLFHIFFLTPITSLLPQGLPLKVP